VRRPHCSWDTPDPGMFTISFKGREPPWWA
jgi:hypothetical protein